MYKRGHIVQHQKFGIGTVVGVEDCAFSKTGVSNCYQRLEIVFQHGKRHVIDSYVWPFGEDRPIPVPVDYDITGVRRILNSPAYKEKTEAQLHRFYTSKQWAVLRFDFIAGNEQRCVCCGKRPEASNDVALVVDHIRPVRWYWSWRLSWHNLQILCKHCNWGKGNRVMEFPSLKPKPQRVQRLR